MTDSMRKNKKTMTSENVEWGQISQFKKERDNNCSLIASVFGLTIDKHMDLHNLHVVQEQTHAYNLHVVWAEIRN